MGWSCSARASNVLTAWEAACREQTQTSNTFRVGMNEYFWERSQKEHGDGAVTGTIWKVVGDGTRAKISGNFRIEGDGTVTRAPAFLKRVKVPDYVPRPLISFV